MINDKMYINLVIRKLKKKSAYTVLIQNNKIDFILFHFQPSFEILEQNIFT